jgi:PKD repeat protein
MARYVVPIWLAVMMLTVSAVGLVPTAKADGIGYIGEGTTATFYDATSGWSEIVYGDSGNTIAVVIVDDNYAGAQTTSYWYVGDDYHMATAGVYKEVLCTVSTQYSVTMTGYYSLFVETTGEDDFAEVQIGFSIFDVGTSPFYDSLYGLNALNARDVVTSTLDSILPISREESGPFSRTISFCGFQNHYYAFQASVSVRADAVFPSSAVASAIGSDDGVWYDTIEVEKVSTSAVVEEYLPPPVMGISNPFASTTSRGVDPTGHMEVAVSAVETYVHVTDASDYQVDVQTYVAANTLLKMNHMVTYGDLRWSGAPYPLSAQTLYIPNDGYAEVEFPVISDMNPDIFTFLYHGKEYDRFWISENGFVVFGDVISGGFSNPQAAFPDSSGVWPDGIIAPLWRDLDITGGTIQCGISGEGEFLDPPYYTIVWSNVKNKMNDDRLTVELILDGYSGSFQFAYYNVRNPAYSLSGSLIPTLCGYEDQMAKYGKVIPASYTDSPSTWKTVTFTASEDNLCYMDRVSMYVIDSQGSGDDANGYVMWKGQNSSGISGVNIRNNDYYLGASDSETLVAAELAVSALGAFEGPVGAVFTVAGILMTIYDLSEDYQPSVIPGTHTEDSDTMPTGPAVARLNTTAQDWAVRELKQDGNLYLPHDMYLAPKLQWYINYDQELGDQINEEHILHITTIVEGHDRYGNPMVAETTNAIRFNPWVVPGAPENLVAEWAIWEEAIDLAWNRPSTAWCVEGYDVYRKTAVTSYSKIGETSWDVLNYADSTAGPGIVYTYCVKARNDLGTSPSSNAATASIPNNPPWISVRDFADIPVSETRTYTVSAGDSDWDPLRFTWIWGDGGVSVTISPSADHVYDAVGTYSLTVWADDMTGADGHNVSDTGYVYVYNPYPHEPVIDGFSVDDVTPSTGQIITFTGSAHDEDGDPMTFTFSFGDGTEYVETVGPNSGEVFEVTVEHEYVTSGLKSVWLTVTGEIGLDSSWIGVNVYLNFAPIGQTPPDINAYVDEMVSVTLDVYDLDGDYLTYTWVWGDGTVDVTPNADPCDYFTASHTYTEPLESVYQVYVDDGQGHNITLSADVTIVPSPDPELWSRYDESGGTLTYDSSGNGYTGTLYGVEFSPGGVSGNCIYSNGDYSDRIDYGNVLGITGDITIACWVKTTSDQQIQWLVTKSPNTGYGRTYDLHIITVDTPGYYWVEFVRGESDGSDYLLVLQYPDILPADGQWHFITVRHNTTTGDCGIRVDDGDWGGNRAVGDGVGTATPSACSLQVGNMNNGGTPRSLVGYIDDVRIWNQFVEDSVIDDVFAEINLAPIAEFSFATTDLTVCVDGSASYDPDGAISTYAWDWGDGTATPPSTTPTASHTYLTPGTYDVHLTVADNGGAIGTKSSSVEVVQPPPVLLTVNAGYYANKGGLKPLTSTVIIDGSEVGLTGGTFLVAPGTHTIQVQNLIVYKGKQYIFLYWLEGSPSSNPGTLTVTGDTTITAVYGQALSATSIIGADSTIAGLIGSEPDYDIRTEVIDDNTVRLQSDVVFNTRCVR